MSGFSTPRNPPLLALITLALLVPEAHALDPARSIDQYAQRTWNVTNGFPRGRPDAISQSAEGYLWIGTERGLIRFDGQTFSRIEDSGLHALPLDHILGIGREKSGVSWVRSLDPSLIRYDNGKFAASRFSPDRDSLVTAMTSARDGSMLFASKMDGLFRSNGTLFQSLIRRQLLPSSPVTSITETSDHDIWLGTADAGLIHIHGATVVSVRNLPSQRVTCLLSASDERVYVGTDRGLVLWDGTKLTNDGIPVMLRTLPVWAILRDRDDNIWIGSDRGLIRLNSQGTSFLEPLASTSPVTALFEDREGDLWAGSAERLLRIQETPIASYAKTMAPYPRVAGVPGETVTAFNQNRDETIWVGTAGDGVAHVHEGRSTTYTTHDGLASNAVFSISEGADATMWFATPSGLSALSNNRWHTFQVKDGLPSANIYSTFVDKAGVVWVGTLAGLAYIRAGRAFATPSDLASPLRGVIFGVTEDNIGSLWVVTSDAVFRVSRARLLAGSLSDGDIRQFGRSDGLTDTQAVRRDPTIVTDSSGTIWISRTRGVASIDPERVRRTAVPTIVHVTQVLIDGDPLESAGLLDLHSDVKRVSIRYEGLNLSSPERIRYRFRLDGFDRKWNEAGASQEAVYTNLAPGQYHFRVAASNADRVWNGAEAIVPFIIVPAFWQTPWFMAACAIALLMMSILVYRLRIYQVTERVKLQFEARFAERNRIARDLHDTLLQSFQGLLLRFQAVENMLPDKPAQARTSLATAIHHAARAITEGRDAVQELRRDESATTLVDTLSSLGQELNLATDSLNAPSYRVLLEGTPRELHPGLQDDLYRISREAVANAFRHAGAIHIELDIQYDPRMLRLRVRDDGVGIDPVTLANGGRDGHWGLPGMQERAKAMNGRLEIWSNPDRGTEIELTVPAAIAYLRIEKPDRNKERGR